MFSYQLPNGEPHLVVKLNNDGKVVYGRSVPEQMHSTVVEILDDPRWSNHFKKVVDFGCGSMRLFKLLRRLNSVEEILNVDTDESILVEKKSRIDPLVSDHLQDRDHPLHVEVLRGSITDAVENLRNTDAVLVVDVIQFLTPDQLEKMTENLFRFMQSKLVVVSTPNHEFNRIWNDLSENGFRSNNHKFEWKRNEFKDWASKICEKFPNYSFATLGVGPPPPQQKKLGSAAQLAIFARKDILERDLVEPILMDLKANEANEVQYKQIHAVDYPFYKDTRSKYDKIEDEVTNYFGHAHKAERYYNRERDIYQIPLKPLLEFASTIKATDEDILHVLKEKNFAVENDFVLLTQEYIEENYNCRGEDDLYEGFDDVDDFLEFEPYHRDLDDNGGDADNLEGRLSSACSINAADDDEENWD